jgi:predicted ATPase with chaperone activity
LTSLFFNGSQSIDPVLVNLDDLFNQHSQYSADFNDVKGQQHVKRALEEPFDKPVFCGYAIGDPR